MSCACSRTPVLWLAALLACALPVIAQQPVFEAGVDLVLVDLTVLGRNDQPVSDLRANEVELRVDGVPRAARWLTFLKAGARGSSQAAAAPPVIGPGAVPATSRATLTVDRTIVLVVDRDSIPLGEGQLALAAAGRFIERLPASDHVAVATMPNLGQLRFDEPREVQRKRVSDAIGTWQFTATTHTIFPWEAVDIAQGNQDVLNQVADRECTKLNANNPSASAHVQSCRSQLTSEANIVADARRREVEQGLEALRDLFNALGAVDGPKHVVLVAGGISAQFNDLLSVDSLARVAGANRVRVHVLQVNGSTGPWVSPEQRLGDARPPLLSLSTAAVNVATATGGLVLAPLSGDSFFKRLEQQLAGLYLLAFEPLPGERDGRPHRIEVRVPGRQGLTVVARTQFVAPSPAVAPPTTAVARSSEPARPATEASPVEVEKTETAPPAAPTEAPVDTAAPAPPPVETPVPSRAARPVRSAGSPEVDAVVDRMAEYVANYGANAAMFVASERYDQRVEQLGEMLRPRRLRSEFAIVRSNDLVGWTGYRDVVEVDGKQLADRRDRLQTLLTGSEDPSAEIEKITTESARFNIGPVARTFNVPTAALFFFHPSRVERFAFKSKGTKTVDGTKVLVLDFKEVARPTLVMKRDGTDIPCEGTVWVVPEDGSIVRTRVHLEKFADMVRMGVAPAALPGTTARGRSVGGAPASGGGSAPAASGGTSSGGASGGSPGGSAGGGGTGSGSGASGGSTTSSGGGQPAAEPVGLPALMVPDLQVLESSADVEVTYRKDPKFGVWLPWKMTELYEGPIPQGTRAPIIGRSTCTAQYEDYRRFATAARVLPPQ